MNRLLTGAGLDHGLGLCRCSATIVFVSPSIVFEPRGGGHESEPAFVGTRDRCRGLDSGYVQDSPANFCAGEDDADWQCPYACLVAPLCAKLHADSNDFDVHGKKARLLRALYPRDPADVADLDFDRPQTHSEIPMVDSFSVAESVDMDVFVWTSAITWKMMATKLLIPVEAGNLITVPSMHVCSVIVSN